ncbi:MAG TPA: hypothetical protein VMP01_10095 [Pirellulaceae bacterium]|nr:hypothetical protein [Pirellulaceae bacterium]
MPRFVLCFVLWLLTAAVAGGAPAEGPVPADRPKSDSLAASSSVSDLLNVARDLASPQFRRRQRAFEQLLAAGEPALPALAETVRADNREARSRALSILVALAASRNEKLARAAQQTLDNLASGGNRTIARELAGALASARLARAQRALDAIRQGGGTVTSDSGDEPAADGPLSVKIGADWQRGSAGLSVLADLPTIAWLSLEGAPIDDAALAYVGQIANLEKLYLKGSRVRGPGLAHLAPLSKLTHLSLRELPLGDAALAALPNLPQLSNLGLDNTQITDAGLAELKRFPELDTLWLDETKVTDAGLAELTSLHQLRTLFLIGTKTGGPGLASLKEIPPLRFLSLKSVELSPAAMQHIAQLAQVETLGLDHTNVTDEQLAPLTRLTRLKTLWLSKTPVTDAGIEHLKQIKSLQMVYFHGSQVTAAGRQALREALPDCTVEPRDDPPEGTRRRRN